MATIAGQMRIVMLLALTLAGCGGSDRRSPEDTLPASCDPITQRIGTYFAEATTVSGNCGPQTSGLVRLDSTIPDGCVFDADDIWSNNGCTLERAMTCPSGEETVRLVAISTQQDSHGDRITGTMTMAFSDARGASVCTGTYRLTYTRQ